MASLVVFPIALLKRLQHALLHAPTNQVVVADRRGVIKFGVQMSPLKESDVEFDDGGIDDEDLTQLDNALIATHDKQTHSNNAPTAAQVEQMHSNNASVSPQSGLIHTVSNRNRRKMRQQKLKRLAALKRQGPRAHSADIEEETSEEEPTQQTSQEESLLSEDDEAVAWILQEAETTHEGALEDGESALTKQMADLMYKTAKSVGNGMAYSMWQSIFQHWRNSGNIQGASSLIGLNPLPSTGPGYVAGLRREVQEFYYAFQAVQQSEVGQELQKMSLHLSLANLHDSYERVTKEMQTSHRQSLQGMRCQANAKRFLFGTLYPELAGIEHPSSNTQTKKKYDALQRLLKRGQRWSYIRQELGEGVLGLIPRPEKSTKFLERRLPQGHFYLWVRVVRQYNPRGVQLGQELQAALQKIFARGSMPRRKLAIELHDYAALMGQAEAPDPFLIVDEGQITSEDERVVAGPTEYAIELFLDSFQATGEDGTVWEDFTATCLPPPLPENAPVGVIPPNRC